MCVSLSIWASGGAQEDYYWRSAMSGGRATLQSRKGRTAQAVHHAGDMVCTNAEGAFLLDLFQIEFKSYADFFFERLAHGKDGRMEALWSPLIRQSAVFNKLPLLIGKQDGQTDHVMVTKASLDLLHRCTAEPLPVTAHFPLWDCYVFKYRAFLLQVLPSRMREIAAGFASTQRRRRSLF